MALRVPEQNILLLDGQVVKLRADHLAIYELEKLTCKSLVEWLKDPGGDHSAVYDLLWCLAATHREDNQLTFRRFLGALPIGEEFIKLQADAMNLLVESLPKAGPGNPPGAVPPESTGAASSSNTSACSATPSEPSGAPA